MNKSENATQLWCIALLYVCNNKHMQSSVPLKADTHYSKAEALSDRETGNREPACSHLCFLKCNNASKGGKNFST